MPVENGANLMTEVVILGKTGRNFCGSISCSGTMRDPVPSRSPPYGRVISYVKDRDSNRRSLSLKGVENIPAASQWGQPTRTDTSIS
jgi:hypothetical protein